MLTECLPASAAASEDPVRGLANYPVKESPSQDKTGQYTVYHTHISKERDSFGVPLQPEQLYFNTDGSCSQKVALLLTELEVRVISLVEAQQLSRSAGETLQTLTISPQTKEVSEMQLHERPLLVFVRESENVEEAEIIREAYRLLHSLLESSKPEPQTRINSSIHSAQESILVEALRRGIETGNRVLTLQHNNEIRTVSEDQQNSVKATIKTGGSSSSGGDIRHSTYKSLDSLEETIRDLEKTLIEISGHPTTEHLYTGTSAKSTRVLLTGSPTSEIKKPRVPPKPSSLSQVHADSCSDAACSAFFLHCFCLGDCLELLMSAPCLNRYLTVFVMENF